MNTRRRCVLIVIAAGLLLAASSGIHAKGFVKVSGRGLTLDGHKYLYIGTNYWYGNLLSLDHDAKRGIQRLRRELDFLKLHGVTNLRLMAGAEGSGPMNGVERVGPPIQPRQGVFDEHVLTGLDTLLSEMSKRDMKAVIFFSNNWEWSGGFEQYLIWNHVISRDLLTRKPDWDELRDTVAKFYTCTPCMADYRRQVQELITRRNSVNGRVYRDDPTIMAWELANEPRPMRPAADHDYLTWLWSSAAMVRKLDPNHLITAGHEGWIGTESQSVFDHVHSSADIDYVTIHIWPKNWGWFRNGRLAEDMPAVLAKTEAYIRSNQDVVYGKPMVIEEFGLPRDAESLDLTSATTQRDAYYRSILDRIGQDPLIAGANFWAFGGIGRRATGTGPGDLIGDPPMEPQGLNSVFDTDTTTWQVIDEEGSRIRGILSERPRGRRR